MATVALVVGVAVVAAIGGYLVGRTNPRRARQVFLAGFLCGSVTGSAVRRRLAQRAFRRVLPRSFSDPRRRSRSRPQKIGFAVR
jgi:uncharacterized membrane protein YfcA